VEHTATYSPEDNKLRLYAAHRLDAEDYAKVKAAGFKWAPKQELFVAPKWTPEREDLLLEMCGEIGDEDYSPEERAADRAERFSGYRDKRRDEAHGHADTYDAGPSAFGHQNRARAERQAARHDRNRGRAVSQWSKAEYWQARTAGVISHALFKSSAHVRRGRIIEIETRLRAEVASYTPADNPPSYIMQTAFDDTEPSRHVWVGPKGRGGRWVKADRLDAIKAGSARWVAHYELRLTYERAMIAAEGGMVAEASIEVGGWFGRHQVLKVNKSVSTGRVVSVGVWGPHPYRTNADGSSKMGVQCINIERMGADAYRAPTDEEREAFKVSQAERKAEKKATTPKAASLINPTDEDAERLQSVWNAKAQDEFDRWRKTPGAYGALKPSKVVRMTQAQYAARSKGSYGSCATAEVCENGHMPRRWDGNVSAVNPPVAFKVRWTHAMSEGGWTRAAYRVIVITDKPQKSLPLDWTAITAPVVEAATRVVPLREVIDGNGQRSLAMDGISIDQAREAGQLF
jgi:hypothetical protein